MTLKGIARRLLRGEFHYVLSRFKTMRQLFAWGRWLRQAADPRFAAQRVLPRQASMFDGVSADECVAALRRDAVAFGLRLPGDVLSALRDHALTHPCTRPHADDCFAREDVRNGRLPDGSPVAIARVRDVAACEAVRRVVSDPLLLRVGRAYLGYWPQLKPEMTWSFVSDLPDALRLDLKQTITFHYDAYAYSFMAANFYLTDTDKGSGAHVMIKGSHGRKPLSMLLGPTDQPDDAVYAHFGRDNEITIEGPAGFGFFQDGACFHKATVPTTRERLWFRILIY